MRKVLVACLLLALLLLWPVVSLLRTPALNAGSDERRTVGPTVVAVDSSGYGHHGVIQGPVRTGRPGRVGGAYSFHRDGSWVQVASTPLLNPGRSDFLVSAWVNIDDVPEPGETYDVVRKGLGYTPDGDFKLEIVGSGRVRCRAKDSMRVDVSVSSADFRVSDGRWQWIGCARTGDTWSVLVDDTVTSELTASLGSVTNTTPLAIASNYGVEDFPQGRIDEVRLVIARKRNSDPSPRAAIDGLRRTKPVGWWRLDEPSATNEAKRDTVENQRSAPPG